MLGLGAIRDMFISIRLADDVTKPLKNVNRVLDTAKLKAKEFTEALHKSREGLFTLGAALSGISAALAFSLKGAVESMEEFEAAMANVSTMVDTTRENMQEMSRQVLEISKRVPVSAVELANALYEVRSAGVDAANAMNYLEVSAKSAIAGVSDTLTAVKAITAVIKGYGMSFSDAQMVSDKLFKTVQLGQTTFKELASEIGEVVPAANALGVSLDELLAAYATLTGVTGNTAEVTTQLGAVLDSFIKPTTKLSSIIRQLGYETGEQMIKELGLVEALKKVVEATDGTAEAIGDLFERQEAITAILAILGPQYDIFNKKLKEMRNSAGAMEEAYRKNVDTFRASMRKMTNAIFAFKVAIGEALAPTLEKIAGIIREVVEIFNKLPEPMKQVLAIGAALTATVAGIAGPLLIFIGGLGLAMPVIGAFTAALSGSIVTISAFVPHIMAVIAALYLLKKAYDTNFLGLRTALKEIGRVIKAIFGAIKTVLSAFWSTVKDTFSPITDLLREFGLIGEETGESFKGALQPIIDFLNEHQDTLRTFGKALGWIVTGPIRITILAIYALVKALQKLMEMFSRVKEKIKPLAEIGRYLTPGMGQLRLIRDLIKEIKAPTIKPTVEKPEYDRKYYEEGSIILKMKVPKLVPEIEKPKLPKIHPLIAPIRFILDRLPKLPRLMGSITYLPKIIQPELRDLTAKVKYLFEQPKPPEIITRIKPLPELRTTVKLITEKLPKLEPLKVGIHYIAERVPKLPEIVARVTPLLPTLPELRTTVKLSKIGTLTPREHHTKNIEIGKIEININGVSDPKRAAEIAKRETIREIIRMLSYS